MPFNHAVANRGKLRDILSVLFEGVHILYKTLVYHKDICVDLRHYLFHKSAIPLFKSLSHDSVVCVVKDLVGDLKSLVKVIAMLSTKLSYKLWYSDNRVSIVKLDSNIVTKVVKSAELSQMLFENIRHRSGGEEIFLLEPEYLALFTVIVRVKHL